MISKKEISEKLSKEFTKDSLKDRINPKTTHPIWSKIRNVSGTISGIGMSLLILNLPEKLDTTLKVITGITAAIAGRAWLNKSK